MLIVEHPAVVQAAIRFVKGNHDSFSLHYDRSLTGSHYIPAFAIFSVIRQDLSVNMQMIMVIGIVAALACKHLNNKKLEHLNTLVAKGASAAISGKFFLALACLR